MQENISKKTLDRLSIFEGLNESELDSLNKMASILNVQPADYLIKEGDTDQTVFVIVDGEIKIFKEQNGKQKELATLTDGDWIGEISFTKKIPRTASAIAAKHSRVIALNMASLDVLEDRTQLYILKQLNDLASERINQVIVNEKVMADRSELFENKYSLLIDYISSIYEDDKIELNKSETIQRIIKENTSLPVYPSESGLKLVSNQAAPNEISEMLKTDPSLLALVLKKINEDPGTDKPISDINHASIILGMAKIFQFIKEENISRTMPDTQVFKEIYSHSIGISCITQELSQALKIGNPRLMFTLGLLHETGNILLGLLKDGCLTENLFIISIDQSRIGSLLLQSWGLPEEIWRAVEFQSYPEFSPPEKLPDELRDSLSILYISHLSYRHFRGWTEKDLPTMFFEEYKKIFGWDNLPLDEIIKTKVLPCLTGKINSFPEPFKKVLNSYLQAIE